MFTDGVESLHEILRLGLVLVPAHGHGPRRAVVEADVPVQVVVGAPVARGAGPVLGLGGLAAVPALAPLAVFEGGHLVRAGLVAVDAALGRALQRVGLGEELLHRMHQVAYPAGAVAALLQRRALVLQGVVSVAVDGQLPLELVQQGGGQPVALVGHAGVGHQGALVLQLVVRAVVSPGKGAVGHHAVRLEGVPLGVVGVVGRVGLGRVQQVRLAVRVVRQGVVGVARHGVVVASAA